MRVVACSVGGVGRHGDAARRHDREVRNQPFGPVLADEGDPVSRLKSDALQRCSERRYLARGLAPVGLTPFALLLGPEKGLVALLLRARNEERDEIVEAFELSGQVPPLENLLGDGRALAARIRASRPTAV